MSCRVHPESFPTHWSIDKCLRVRKEQTVSCSELAALEIGPVCAIAQGFNDLRYLTIIKNIRCCFPRVQAPATDSLRASTFCNSMRDGAAWSSSMVM